MTSVKQVVMDIVSTSASVGLITATGLDKVIPFGNQSMITRALKQGILYTASSDLVNLALLGQSKILSGDWRGLVDNIFFFGSVSGLVEKTNLDAQFANVLLDLNIFPRNIVDDLANGAIISTARIASLLMDQSVNVPNYLRLNHITTLVSAL